MTGYLFTSESVTEGHPDKVCDKISDALLDAYLAKDPYARVACETMVKTGYAIVAGEVTAKKMVDISSVVRNTIAEIGYNDPTLGFDSRSCAIFTAVERQSPDIAQGVDQGKGLHKDQGAGDQGLMFGFAVAENKDLMPLPIDLAHKLTKRLALVRKKNIIDWLRPDGKSQVTVEYENNLPKRIDTVVLSTQHAEGIKHKDIRDAVMEEVIKHVLPNKMVDSKTKFHINPTGRFVIGGPAGDAGLTGRKIIVDTYGGAGRHGGGAFSGKDPSKVDRSAAYYARYVAKNIVASKVATKCEVQLAYAIGVAQPVGVYVTTFGTGLVADESIARLVRKIFDFRPRSIIEQLDLLRPIYSPTAAYGHFGRSEASFSWEKTDRARELADDLLPKPLRRTASKGQRSANNHQQRAAARSLRRR